MNAIQQGRHWFCECGLLFYSRDRAWRCCTRKELLAAIEEVGAEDLLECYGIDVHNPDDLVLDKAISNHFKSIRHERTDTVATPHHEKGT